MKVLSVILTIVGLLGVSPAVATAQDCRKAETVLQELQVIAESILDEIGCRYLEGQTGLPSVICKLGAGVVHQLEKKLWAARKKAWKKAVKNGWATVGPRDLHLGRSNKGHLVGPHGRLFISPFRSSAGVRDVIIEVKKTGGRGMVGVSICTHNVVDGAFKKVTGRTFKGGAQKDSYKYTLRNANNKFIMVHLQGKTAVKSFKYTLTAVDSGGPAPKVEAGSRDGKKAKRKAKKAKRKAKRANKKAKRKAKRKKRRSRRKGRR